MPVMPYDQLEERCAAPFRSIAHRLLPLAIDTALLDSGLSSFNAATRLRWCVRSLALTTARTIHAGESTQSFSVAPTARPQQKDISSLLSKETLTTRIMIRHHHWFVQSTTLNLFSQNSIAIAAVVIRLLYGTKASTPRRVRGI